MSYITKNSQGPVTNFVAFFFKLMSYITKNSQGPVTQYTSHTRDRKSYITKNSQGPVTIPYDISYSGGHTLLKIHRVL